jgi:hypothetical protein
MKTIIDYPDIWYQVKYNFIEDESRLEFEAFRIHGLADGTSENPHDVEKENMIKGYVKFDGCMDVDSNSMHFCGRYMTKQFGELFDKIYDKAKELGLEDD